MTVHKFILFVLIFCTGSAYAQPVLIENDIIEVSGIIISRNEKQGLQYVPFATVAVNNSNRGTYWIWRLLFDNPTKF
jgi:hypothetical protein